MFVCVSVRVCVCVCVHACVRVHAEAPADQMMTATSLMMASLRLSKKSLRAWPCCFMLPMTRPRQTENTTMPRAFTPLEEPDTGTVSTTVSCQRGRARGGSFEGRIETLVERIETRNVENTTDMPHVFIVDDEPRD